MENGQSSANAEQRPWYYRNAFLVPAFLLSLPVFGIFLWPTLWPVWPVLILRSPWHRGFFSGTFAWAMMLSGVVMTILILKDPDESPVVTVALLVPGLVVTIIIQTLWNRYKRGLPPELFAPVPGAAPGERAKQPNQTSVRRRPRRRSSRPGRASRHPYRY